MGVLGVAETDDRLETRPILPPATLGVLGSGQLGRMFALAAKAMGYRVHTFSPERDTPTGQVADREVVAAYEDLNAVRAFARGVAAVTFEFENIPFATAKAAAEVCPVRPGGHVLHTTQHRLREKTFLSTHGFPLTPFERVTSEAELVAAYTKIGAPAGGAVLKTAGWGYDGKGQIKLTSPGQLEAAWKTLNTREAVLEAFVTFGQEASVMVARDSHGHRTTWGLIENEHANHILDVSISPARLPGAVGEEAIRIAMRVAEALEVVGLLCVEFFVKPDGGLLINELAPRPHNSGHLTIDACVTSQFEQQVRTLCNLPLGSTAQFSEGAAMAQLLGELWGNGEPDWRSALEDPAVKLHLYGKAEARPGRKMGHLTATGSSREAAREKVLAARARLVRRGDR